MMSELPLSVPPRTRRRADAERSRAAIIEATCRLLSERPEASIEEIALAAGLTRQTVYAHFASRERLLSAVFDHIMLEVVAALDAAALDEGPPAAALDRLLRTSWRLLTRYPFLLHETVTQMPPEESHARHQPIFAPLERLIRRGQAAGDFDRRLSTAWLLAATVGLGHTAGTEVGAGRMTMEEAAESFRLSVLRLFGVEAAAASDH